MSKLKELFGFEQQLNPLSSLRKGHKKASEERLPFKHVRPFSGGLRMQQAKPPLNYGIAVEQLTEKFQLETSSLAQDYRQLWRVPQ